MVLPSLHPLRVSWETEISESNLGTTPSTLLIAEKSFWTGDNKLPQPSSAFASKKILEPEPKPQSVTTLNRMLTTFVLKAEPAEPIKPFVDKIGSLPLISNL